jgi:hypothetical protein
METFDYQLAGKSAVVTGVSRNVGNLREGTTAGPAEGSSI